MRREAANPADWTWPEWQEVPYDYSDGGWMGPGHLWGYWDDLDGVPFTNADFVRVDNLTISDGWIEPPCL